MLILRNITYTNEGTEQQGDILVTDEGTFGKVALPHSIAPASYPRAEVIDGTGLLLLPGVIDEHIHSREPGMTHKGDLRTETMAAAAGGVTSVMDMPNVVPQTTTLTTLDERFELGRRQSLVNYSFYFGATQTNAPLLRELDAHRVCGIKVFMGSSTGGMLVDDAQALRDIFAWSPRPIVTHCEDTALIQSNMQQAQALYGDDPDVSHHPEIRSRESCLRSSSMAASIAHETGARLHIAHITTAEELDLLDGKHITGEACVPHLLFCDEDYARLGTRIKCNPAIKTRADRDALRHALTDGSIATIATDHAPHLLGEKEGGARRAVSGMPMVQFSLVSMLDLVDQGILSRSRLVDLMCHAPARLFGVECRGFVREGYHADFVLLRRQPWTLTSADILSRCGWSPLEGHTFGWKVEQTYCNGRCVWSDGVCHDVDAAQELVFS